MLKIAILVRLSDQFSTLRMVQLIFIDFKNAFDSLEWHYLFSCLETFHFGPNCINWVKMF